MKFFLACLFLFVLNINGGSMCHGSDKEVLNNNLTEFQKSVIFEKNTEKPFSGQYNNFYEKGIYTCANCNAALYYSSSKFKSGCGWPSFDDEIKGAIKRSVDPDGRRVEISCSRCGAHLGHVFEGEGYTNKNIRFCVNSASMNFVPEKNIGRAYFGGGCFWGVEFYMEKLKGVLFAESGYMGGTIKNPSYADVCTGKSGHIEVVEVVYDKRVVDFEDIAKLFFEIHDPTQKDGQGPDIGEQYRSHIFYSTEDEKKIAQKLIDVLEKKGLNIATILEKKKTFYSAEEYHQNYYEKKKVTPSCHRYIKGTPYRHRYIKRF